MGGKEEKSHIYERKFLIGSDQEVRKTKVHSVIRLYNLEGGCHIPGEGSYVILD